jgi:hypothetical protein
VSRMRRAAACVPGRVAAASPMRLPTISEEKRSAPVLTSLVLGLDDPSRHV